MKKFLVILSALICILGLSVISSASTVYKPNQHSFVHFENGYYVLDVDIKASQFTEEQLTFWNSFTDALTGNSTDIPFVIYNKSSNQLIFSYIQPNTYRFYYASGSNSYQLSCYNGSSYITFSSLSVDISSGIGNDLINYGQSKNLVLSLGANTYVFWGYSNLVSNDSNNATYADKINYVDWDGMRLQIKDDLGEEEDPDLPSSSSPAWIPPVVSDPVIPEGDEYVFYDTKILGIFLNHVRSQIVRAANVGWLIFGFILVWHVIKRVIKAFSSR